MKELTEVSNVETLYPYSTSLTSMGGFKNLNVSDNTSFEQMCISAHGMSLEESHKLCLEKCQAKLTRQHSLTTKKL